MNDEIGAALEAIWEEAYRFGSDGGSDYHEKDAVFANARAAIEAHEAWKVPDGWQPIETAPKDKTVLLYGAKRLEMCVGMNHSRDGWVTDTTSEWASMYPPTHWMPLPDMPSASAPPAPQHENETINKLRAGYPAAIDAAIREQASVLKPEPVAWKHNCAALLTNDVELWIDACPHCGKPRTHPAPVREPLTIQEVEQINARWNYELHGDRLRFVVREVESAHGITKDTQ